MQERCRCGARSGGERSSAPHTPFYRVKIDRRSGAICTSSRYALRIGDEVGRDIAAIELHPFLFAKDAGTAIKIDDELEGDQKVGAEILKRALDEPLRQLIANAGLEGSVVVEEIRRQNRPNL